MLGTRTAPTTGKKSLALAIAAGAATTVAALTTIAPAAHAATRTTANTTASASAQSRAGARTAEACWFSGTFWWCKNRYAAPVYARGDNPKVVGYMYSTTSWFKCRKEDDAEHERQREGAGDPHGQWQWTGVREPQRRQSGERTAQSETEQGDGAGTDRFGHGHAPGSPPPGGGQPDERTEHQPASRPRACGEDGPEDPASGQREPGQAAEHPDRPARKSAEQPPIMRHRWETLALPPAAAGHGESARPVAMQTQPAMSATVSPC